MMGDPDAPHTPVLWETMVFGPSPFDRWQRRYTSKLDALAGHVLVRALVERFGDPPRRLKKALRKARAGQPLRPGESRGVGHWYARVRAYEIVQRET
jgi:hypothetical protein